LVEWVAQDKIALVIGECSLANLIYLSFDIYKLPNAQERLIDFISVCHVISGGKRQMIEGLASNISDKEDALQYYTALHHGVDYFVTRNIHDYITALGSLPVSTPEESFPLSDKNDKCFLQFSKISPLTKPRFFA
jgi:hypothetical protein